MKSRTRRVLLWAGIGALAAVTVAGGLWFRTFRRYPPKEVMQDVRAGLAARNIAEPKARVERFLEVRYGPLTDPVNRERAFLDFFNVDHIKGLNFIVSRTPAEQRQANTQAMAQWIANYRNSMSPQEKAALRAALGSEAGRATLARAAAQFLSQDVYYRGDQKQVIQELMTTVAAVQRR